MLAVFIIAIFKIDLVALLWHVLISILLYFMPVYVCIVENLQQ